MEYYIYRKNREGGTMNELSRLKDYLASQGKAIRKLEHAEALNIRKHLEELLYMVEKETVYLRYLISLMPDANSDMHYPESIKNSYEIAVNMDCIDGQTAFVIDLPFLLPNRRTATTEFKRTIAESLRFVLRSFCKKNRVLPLQKAVVTFVSYYAPSNIRKLNHENDNAEISVVLNTLTGLLIPDDSSLCCDLHILSVESNESFTRIIVQNKEEIKNEGFDKKA